MPEDGLKLTASEWKKEAPSSGLVEYLLGKTEAKKSHPESTTHQTQALPEETTMHLPVAVDTPPSALPSATVHTAISVVTKSNSDGSEPPRVVATEVSAADDPTGGTPQIAPAA